MANFEPPLLTSWPWLPVFITAKPHFGYYVFLLKRTGDRSSSDHLKIFQTGGFQDGSSCLTRLSKTYCYYPRNICLNVYTK